MSYLETVLPPTKAIAAPGVEDWITGLPEGSLSDPETEAQILRLIIAAGLRGVVLFQETIPIGMDWDLVNSRVVKWARTYMSKWLKGLDDTTVKALREALEAFVTQPGFTLKDVAAVLPFDEARAIRIATTEITRIYAEAEMEAGRALQEEFPDVRVIKTWFTNNDDRVCPICQPLDGKSVELHDGFGVEAGEAGLLNPPAHVGCRCWISTRTDI